MTKRRGKGEGSVFRRKDGSWVAQYVAGDKRRYIYGKTRKDVAARLSKAVAERDSGIVYDSENLKVTDYLDRWLDSINSVTQLEVFRAIQMSVPMFTFVDEGVFHDHMTYEKNKHKPILSDIEFPSIERQETASYIFEFINFLRLRAENDSVVSFSKPEDIESHLRKQWSGLFQRLLHEQQSRDLEEQRIDSLTNQIADLRTAVLTSITGADLQETARGAIKFRSLIDFIFGLNDGSVDMYQIVLSDRTWDEILETYQITEIRPDSSTRPGRGAVMIRADGTYYQLRMPPHIIDAYAGRWSEFRQLPRETRNAIVNAVSDNAIARPIRNVQYVREQFVDEVNEPSTIAQSVFSEEFTNRPSQ